VRWQLTDRGDPQVAAMADRHYSRKTVGAAQFTPPGRVVVLRTPDADAVWVSSWPRFTRPGFAWHGAWLCTIFRNESGHLSSELVTEAVAVTRHRWPAVPTLGMVTFIDAGKVRRKRDPGRCFRRAGFVEVGRTIDRGLIALQLTPAAMPQPAAPLFDQGTLDLEEVPS
jgi:hypothetical protein